MSGGAPDTSSALIAPPSLERSSVFTMCFLDKITDYEGIDGVMSSDDYAEELLHLVISQLEPDYALSDFRVLAFRDDEDAPPAPDNVRLRMMLLLILNLLIFWVMLWESLILWAHHFLLIFCWDLCNTPKDTLVVFDMFRVFCRHNLNVS